MLFFLNQLRFMVLDVRELSSNGVTCFSLPEMQIERGMLEHVLKLFQCRDIFPREHLKIIFDILNGK